MNTTYNDTSLSRRKIGTQVFGLIALIVLVGLAASGWYLYAQKPTQIVNNTTDTLTTTQNSIGTSSPTSDTDQATTPSTETESLNIPEGYNQITSSTCMVKFPIPTNDIVKDANELDENSEWRFESRDNVIDIPSDITLTRMESIYWMRNDGLGSGYVPGSFGLHCGKNTNNISLDELFNAVKTNIEKPNAENIPEYQFVVTKGSETTKWGQSVITYSVSGGMYTEDLYYLVATEDYIYQIGALTMSPNQSIKDAVQTILDNIEFIK
jgi:hypothetical protein